MKFLVIDFYENPHGEVLYVGKTLKDAKKFCKQFMEDTDGESILVIRKAVSQ